jgi:hypothetical protein
MGITKEHQITVRQNLVTSEGDMLDFPPTSNRAYVTFIERFLPIIIKLVEP